MEIDITVISMTESNGKPGSQQNQSTGGWQIGLVKLSTSTSFQLLLKT